ncbi:MAG TPA: amidohydrolase family protein [Chloroflexota bacterium]|nr:amidohydrolase family protein [Chloroflexota bacterium]
MLHGHRVFDADAHVVVSQRAWADLPERLRARRPRPVHVEDAEEMSGYKTSWFCDGVVIPHPWGERAQPGNTPRGSLDLETFPGVATMTDSRVSLMQFGGQDLSDPDERLKIMDQMGIDTSVVYPSTFYAIWTTDPELEAALYRSYNRYVGKACQYNAKRLKFSGLLPLRHPDEACRAIREMRELGAVAAITFSTAGERLLSDPAFSPVFDELTRARLPLCIHFGASYPPLWNLARTMYMGNILSMSVPVFMAFFAITAGGLLDRYPDLKVAFLEFGSEWVLYAVPRMDNYLTQAKTNGLPYATDVPVRMIEDYARSGNIYVACEAEDRVLPQEIECIGEDQILFASDIPHPEMRENAAAEILERNDLTDIQKRKILWDNAARFFGEP